MISEAIFGEWWPPPTMAATPRGTIHREGCASLYHFTREEPPRAGPLLLVPSLINRWYILDLRPGASVAAALVEAGLDVYCLDWGVPGDEDRYWSWDDVLRRLQRAVRRVRRHSGCASVGLMGYCMGGTLSAIYSALFPGEVKALVNLLGPIDFSRSGRLGEMVDASFFDPDVVADAGNVSAHQMQSGFVALRPTNQLAKLVGAYERHRQGKDLVGFRALEAWAADNIPFPAAAYRTYIRDLYQRNALVAGQHRALGRRVDLRAIACPTLAITAGRDEICPPDAASALLEAVGSADVAALSVAGGHVGAVVGSRASRELYPMVADWLVDRLPTTPRENLQ